jgi:tRNA(adenine34) deaminase
MNTDFMLEALSLAREAYEAGEVPVGAVVTIGNKVIGRGRNKREKGHNALYHAEIEAIDQACKRLGGWRLWECDIYVTLEPCPMCAGAIINARLKKVVFGAFDKKAGSCSNDSVIDLFSLPYNHKPEVWAGICEKQCSEILSDFFKNLREGDEN